MTQQLKLEIQGQKLLRSQSSQLDVEKMANVLLTSLASKSATKANERPFSITYTIYICKNEDERPTQPRATVGHH
jgi:hypothetical protein